MAPVSPNLSAKDKGKPGSDKPAAPDRAKKPAVPVQAKKPAVAVEHEDKTVAATSKSKAASVKLEDKPAIDTRIGQLENAKDNVSLLPPGVSRLLCILGETRMHR